MTCPSRQRLWRKHFHRRESRAGHAVALRTMALKTVLSLIVFLWFLPFSDDIKEVVFSPLMIRRLLGVVAVFGVRALTLWLVRLRNGVLCRTDTETKRFLLLTFEESIARLGVLTAFSSFPCISTFISSMVSGESTALMSGSSRSWLSVGLLRK